MKKRMLALVLLVVFAIGILAACGKDSPLTADEAQKVALEHLGINEKDATVHAHVTSENGIPCYSIHVSTASGDHTVVIHAGTGEVLSSAEGTSH